MNMKKILSLFFIVAMLASCAPQPLLTKKERSDLEYLVGKPAKNVIYSYGPPAEKINDDTVGEIWVYYFTLDRSPVSTSSYTLGGNTQIRKYMFFIEDERVKHWTVTTLIIEKAYR